ncbi:CTP synthase isoform X2 [Selaginella moellendorffii]|uniref:CTP synthase isoform X2 n=1 Tax=Selaginella moellendorffii TaxID=88036 RepID=UPI000D1CF079|nr:CTP synthase isoform X2 [Selaginella moellendorffii]|eukprot:XP_002972089.2 CTP synthase isoform X2 [Selaginella moellendorffii]
MKYVIVTGGVVSGLGKGVTASSIGVVLQSCGLRVTSIKIDPYLNTDAGTMSPFEHGEVFVLDDGGEVDLDLGNYERFLDVTLTKNNNITTGKIYQSVIDAERRGDYLGKTVQVVPHITVEIQEWIERVAVVPVDGKEGAADVCVIELGGTIGDIESSPFVEALRQFQFRVGQENFCLVHVSLIPVLGVVGEQKTKPTQHSVQALRALGLTPDLLGCRSAKPLEQCTREKLSQFCHVPAGHILSIHDVSNIWHVPLLLRDQNVHLAILKKLNLSSAPQPELSEWTQRAERSDALSIPVKIGMVGKYTGLSDSYLSVLKALTHASLACGRKLVIEWVASTDLEDGSPRDLHDAAWAALKSVDGILVPGGFGDRGTQGKVLAAKYARENNVPYLGVCLGMQIAVIEFARSVLGLDGANSTEFDPATPHPCVLYMPEISRTHKGGTMRLGVRRTFFQTPNCLTSKLYGNESFVDERHRHRYEVNPELVDRLEEAGLTFVGKDETGRRMEIVELPEHKYFVGVQFHPEFKSRPGKPSPVFLGLILAASKQLDSYLASGKNAGTMVTTMDNGHSFDCVANGTAEIHVNGVATKKQQQQQQADPSKFKRLERELLQIQAMVKELKEREEEIREDLRKGRGGAGDIFMED